MPLPIDVGRHVVVARGGGFERQFEVTLAEGESKHLEITPIGGKSIPKPVTGPVDKAPSAQNASKKGTTNASGAAFKTDDPSADRAESGSSVQRTIGFISLGVGVAGLGAGTYFAARTFSKKDAASTMCTDAAPCSTQDEVDAYERTKSEAVNFRTYSYISFGVGGAAAVTGAILLLTAPKVVSAGWRLAPAVGQGTIGALVGGTW
jgi:hypothetical protein